MSHLAPDHDVTHAVFADPVVQLAAICPICALSALSPAAALAALSPTLRAFNPAINPAAALLAFSLPPGPARVQARVTVRLQTRVAALLLKALLRGR